jgi:hypothetical protein
VQRGAFRRAIGNGEPATVPGSAGSSHPSVVNFESKFMSYSIDKHQLYNWAPFQFMRKAKRHFEQIVLILLNCQLLNHNDLVIDTKRKMMWCLSGNGYRQDLVGMSL